MSKGLKLIVLSVILTVMSVNYYLTFSTYYKRINTENTLDLVSMVLKNSTSSKLDNLNNISNGYLNTKFEIDKNKLIYDFFDVLESTDADSSIKSNIVSLNLVNDDRLYTYDMFLEKWLPVEFYSSVKDGDEIFLSVFGDECYRYDSVGRKVYGTISDYNITDKQRQDIVINKLNEVIGKYTKSSDYVESFGIKIKNTLESNGEEIYKQSFFNQIDDITLFVIYKDVRTFTFTQIVNNRFTNYRVSGYTLSF